MVRGSWIKPGAVIIDVGINPVEVRKLFCWFVIKSSNFFFSIIFLHPLFSPFIHAYRLVYILAFA